MMRWLEIAVDAAPDSAEDIRMIMARWASTAVAVEERVDENSPKRICRVTAYLPDGERLAATRHDLLSALWHVGRLGVESARTPIERWADESEWHSKWKAFFKPAWVGRILLAPAWDDSVGNVDSAVRIDPGMAFGTGLHVTTRQSLLAMQDWLTAGDDVLDLGTGSGVLAIAAARLGAESVKALDTDPKAVEAARENVSLNDVGDVVTVAHGSLDKADSDGYLLKKFDLLVANIVAAVHCRLAGAMIDALAPGGTLILGGIVETREAGVAAAFAERAMEVVERSHDGDWVCLTLQSDTERRRVAEARV